MTERLSALDASFLHLEAPTTPMHVGGVAIFSRPRGAFDYDALVAHVAARIGLVPRYRQRIVPVPGNIANPVWVDDPAFDLSYHVRRSALPRPGTDEQLLDLVARLMSRPLDRSRPLWEMYIVDGLSGSRFAVISKTHHAMVDGVGAVDIGQVILDPTPKPSPATPEVWMPSPAPSAVDLVLDAVSEIARRPTAAVEAIRTAMIDVQATAQRVAGLAGGMVAAVVTASRPAPAGPLNVEIGQGRRFAVARTQLEDYRAIRARHGTTVNDVVLATVTGALRTFLMSRGEDVRDATTLRALVPVSVRDKPEVTSRAVTARRPATRSSAT